MVTPRIPVNTTRKINTTNMILAIEAAPEAISVKPNTAAIIAITKNTAVHLNIILNF